MKNTLIIIQIFFASMAFGQVFINGAANGAGTMTNSSVLLEFKQNVNRGIILPWNTTAITAPVNGTFILSTADKAVKVFSNNAWVNLSGGAKTTNAIDLTLQAAPYVENTSAKVVIGNTATAPDGILVLESPSKAMVLPYVTDPDVNIGNPAPGLMVFDPVKELVCVYNGTQWSYWSAK